MKNLKDRLNANGQKADLQNLSSAQSQEKQTDFYKMSGLFTPGNTMYQINSLNSLIQLVEDLHIQKMIVLDSSIDYIDNDQTSSVSASFDIPNILQDIFRLYPSISANSLVIEMQYNPFLKIKIGLSEKFGKNLLMVIRNKSKVVSRKSLERAKEYLGSQNVIINGDIDFSASTKEVFEVFKDSKLLVINNPFLEASDAIYCPILNNETGRLISEIQNRIILAFEIPQSILLLKLLQKSQNVLLFTKEQDELLDPYRWGISSASYLRKVLPVIIRE